MRLLECAEVPAYVYDLDEVRRAHGLLRGALPGPCDLLYSLKANPHPAIVAALAELGCGAEVCSAAELDAALQAGVPAGMVQYTGPGKRDTEVAGALSAGVRWFSVDSPSGLAQVARAAQDTGPEDVRCLLRVNAQAPPAGRGLTMTGVASQFGSDADWIAAQPAVFRHPRLAGFHLYIASNVTDEDALEAHFASAASTARRLAEVLGLIPAQINLGGGFGAPFARAGVLPCLPTLGERLTGLLDRELPGWRARRPQIVFESGRYLSGTCGRLITRVADVKHSHGTPVVVLESGINHLGGMSGLRRLPPLVPDVTADRPPDGEELRQAIIAGPLCTPLDTWARAVSLPRVQPGDLVQVPNVGAYGLSASLLAFLGHPAPHEVVVSRGQIVEVSQLVLQRRAVPVTEGRGVR